MDDFIYYLNIIALGFFTLVVLLSLYRELRYGGISPSPRRDYAPYWVMLIFAMALVLRLWGFGLIPGGINQDGAMAAVDGKALADYGTDRFGTKYPAHLYAWGFGQMSSLLSYLIAVFVRLFGLNMVTARLPQLICSMLGGVCFYIFLRDGFGKRTGLIGALLMAICPWHFMQSRWALDCNLLPHFFIAGLCLLQKGLKGRRIWLYVSMVFFGLCMYCYGIALYTVSPFLLLLGLYLLIKKELRLSELLGCALVWLALSWPFIATMAINYFELETISLPFVTLQYFPGSVRSGDILFFSDDIPGQLWENLKSFCDVVILQEKDLAWNDMTGFGTVYKFSMPLALGGLFALFRRKNGRTLALAGLMTGIFAGLATNGANINRVNLVFYFVLLLIALGLELVFSRLRQAALPSLALFLAAAVYMAGTYFGDYADSVKYYFYDGFGAAISAAEDSGAERIYVTADAQAEGYAHVSEILTLFYADIDAEYFQGKSNISGGESLLPYKERYHYISMDENSAAMAGEDAAFVIKASDGQYFPAEDFNVQYYGGYAAVYAK